MRVLITGAAGFLGHGLVEAFRDHHDLRLMDVVEPEGPGECRRGDVSSPQDCEAAVEGMDGVVIAHMLSRTHDRHAYEQPAAPFTVNVTGTANLFAAAVHHGVKRAVLISSTTAVNGYDSYPPVVSHDIQPRTKGDVYCLTKGLQEMVAQHYARSHDLAVRAIRVAGIVDAKERVNKYGRPVTKWGGDLIDRCDIGEGARLALEKATPGYDVFPLFATDVGIESWDVGYTMNTLGWKPRHDFSDLPRDA